MKLAKARLFKILATMAGLVGCAATVAQMPVEPEAPVSVAAPPSPPPLSPRPVRSKRHPAKAITLQDKSIRGHSVTVVRIDLKLAEPDLIFAAKAEKPIRKTEPFSKIWRKVPGEITASGTFYGISNRETMGTIVSGGKVCQSPGWDDRGTALIVDHRGRGKMVTIRLDGRPRPEGAKFWLQAGPRLIRDRQLWFRPGFEGFFDPSLFGRAKRLAIGLAGNGRTMLLVAFKTPVTLASEALILRDLGVADAMNLDGGPSTALAFGGKLVVAPLSHLTHVLVVRPKGEAVAAKSGGTIQR